MCSVGGFIACGGILCLCADLVLNTPVIVVYRFGIYGLGFLLGYFIFSHDEVMDKLEKNWYIFSLLAVAFCIAFVVCNWGKPYPDHEVLDTVLCNAYAWFGTLGVLAFMKKWGGTENGFSVWMSKKSLEYDGLWTRCLSLLCGKDC